MRLTNTLNPAAEYRFQLVGETDDALTFTLQGDDGCVLRVTLSADMVTLPDAAMLFATVVEQRDSESAAEFWAHGPDSYNEPSWLTSTKDYVNCNQEPPHWSPPTWTITPDGREIDLHIVEGGLF